MAQDDWRLRIELEEEGHASDFLERIGLDLGSEARELARNLKLRRLPVSREGHVLFVYGSTGGEMDAARTVVEAELASLELTPKTTKVEHWLHEEDRWDDEPPAPDADEEMLEHGYAPWEVRVECDTLEEAIKLADQLEGEGYGIARDFRYVIAGTASEDDAKALAERLHGTVEPGGELVWEVTPQNPFAIFGGLGG